MTEGVTARNGPLAFGTNLSLGRARLYRRVGGATAKGAGGGGGGAVTRNTAGLVIGGRDAWLSSVAYHAVQDDPVREV